MLRAIVLASFSAGAFAQDSVTGMPGCACLGALPDSVVDIDCDYDWAFNGKCVKTVGLVSNFTTYSADYGESCKGHKEPGHSACFDITKAVPVEKPPTDQADWCYAKWCYIDPCNCDASDATKSDYFPDSLFYSYATCGDKNTYTALESATNTVGNAECNQAASPAAAALKDIVATAIAAGSFKVLAEMLTKADLVKTLQGTGPFTVFAPTDDAFAAFLKANDLTKEAVLAMPDLAAILTYHVVAGSVKSTDLTNGMTPATVNGAKLTITIDGATVKVNTATVTAADVMCSNGVIHIVDQVLNAPKDDSSSGDAAPVTKAPTATATTNAAGEAASDANSLKMGLGLLLAGMGALM